MRLCTIEGCGRPYYGHGLCEAHWLRQRLGKPLDVPVRRRIAGSLCEVDGCRRPHTARGLCVTHYERFARTGSALPEVPIRGESLCVLCAASPQRRNSTYCSTECQRFGEKLSRFGRDRPALLHFTTRDKAAAVRRARALVSVGYRWVRGVRVPAGCVATFRRGSLFHVRWRARAEEEVAA